VAEIVEGNHRIVVALLLGIQLWAEVLVVKPAMVSPQGEQHQLNHIVLAQICTVENVYRTEAAVHESDFERSLRYYRESHLPMWRKRGGQSDLIDYTAYLAFLVRIAHSLCSS
jgi:hypothetical protein